LQHRYCEILRDSKFALCPRGTGTGSIRLFEAMSLGICPVIIADAWLPPIGPEWNQISLRIAERDIGNIGQILLSHERDHVEMGLLAQRAWLKYFADESYFNYIVDACFAMKERQTVPESAFWHSRHVLQYLIRFYMIQPRVDLVRHYSA
jgi:Exostosin family